MNVKNTIKHILNYKVDFQEFKICKIVKGRRYIGVKKHNYTYKNIGKHYCSIGLWCIEVQCYNSLKV